MAIQNRILIVYFKDESRKENVMNSTIKNTNSGIEHLDIIIADIENLIITKNDFIGFIIIALRDIVMNRGRAVIVSPFLAMSPQEDVRWPGTLRQGNYH